jgi:CSLREA domain-containing protein
MERRPKVWALGLLVIMVAGLLIAAKPAHADTFTVTNAADPGDGFCNAQGCTLREAIEVANARSGADTIKFNISGGGVKTITPDSELPTITGPVTIDGYTQPGSKPNSRATGAIDAVILIELSGVNGEGFDGLQIVAPGVVVRGLAINRFSGNGINISGGTGARIEGNFIGTDASGTLDRGNGDGVDIKRGKNNVVGGTTPASRILISGNDRANEVQIDGEGGNRVQGNLIGVKNDATSPLGGSLASIEILGSNNTIGGAEPVAGNVIANSLGAGVFVFGTGNRILSNSIFSNGGLGIDLLGDGRTLNDPKDPDAGPNNRQNFPVLASAERLSGGKTIIEGALDSTPSTKRKKRTFTIQFFSNPQGQDEGKTFLGQKRVTTSRQGLVSFSFETNRTLALGDGITATATGPGGNTSEFSDPVPVVGALQTK